MNTNRIMGLQVSLSGDGSILSVSGHDIDKNFDLVKVFRMKDCLDENSNEIGDTICNHFEPYYTEECEYDGGDCRPPSSVEGLDICVAPAKDYFVSVRDCFPGLPYYSKECNYDGDRCPLSSPVEGYPNCFVSFPGAIGDGLCWDILPYNSYQC